ncbi:TPA: heme-binding protein [Streptococcus equi subsp. zooepidemicus]|nr:heme-binding protein [Streptococcus equi subsp. zooepidemicus]HEL0196212.1 heme-binding protein [Streptococcus equi subsp. zooepidemicus]HEL0206351.1 heme-binding protein [Streptococcus equi subsp. zooepidemicus]HEL0531885.1 heme-binding protein [Streptococcus equi subsp. zooepidemicus]HEL0567979.1 heme-binding protein [Streptococcus equi subsp. zooepidemicus]
MKIINEEHMIKRLFKKLIGGLVILLVCLAAIGGKAYADKGELYSCVIRRDYRHPVSGQIEDSGGEHAFEIGQGMVEGTVYSNGMLEVTSAGDLYLTFRMSLADFSGNYQFWVQPGGAGAFQAAAYSVTKVGTDTNGTTKDIAIALPDINTVVRGSMYVEPMGREVVFYLSPSELQEGYSGDMVASFAAGEAKADHAVTAPAKADEKKAPSKPDSKDDKSAPNPSTRPIGQSSTLKKQSSPSKKGQAAGLTTSLDKSKPESSQKPVNNPLSVLVYYIPTALLLSGALVLFIKKKRKNNEESH